MKTYITCSESADSAQHESEDAQDSLAVTADIVEKKVAEARRHLVSAIEECRDAWRTVQDSVVSGAKAAGQSVRDHPYRTLGIALGAGLLLGLLMHDRQRRVD